MAKFYRADNSPLWFAEPTSFREWVMLVRLRLMRKAFKVELKFDTGEVRRVYAFTPKDSETFLASLEEQR